ncbi:MULTISPECIES: hypothetical protein [Saccharopolyspora]|uniref:Uncharacterized protein n=1 Tax=Saccharopolyspora cebuensis TaxID=418759 RepID=A0ABV4CPG5_9PSEU
MDEPTARRLVEGSGGVLVVYACPEGDGLHVCNPDFESSQTRAH